MTDAIPSRTLVVTIDAHEVPDYAWMTLKRDVNHAIDKAISAYCTDGTHVWRRSDDVAQLLKDAE